MELKSILQKIDSLKLSLDGLRPISEEAMGRFTQKIRLEWNYHSNSIEGNRLTYGETKALILFGTTAQAKPLKDHLEVQGHNEAVKYIEDIIRQDRPLTENFIRELHEMVLKEPYDVDAITPDGKPTKRTIQIGKYKSVPNHVKTKTGEIFRFASVEETPAEMESLISWYKEEVLNPSKHPVLLAIEFHYRFIRIHPFDDGNGRIARLMMNFIFMQFGFTPAIIKTEDKQNYFEALQQADAGNLEFFFKYVATQLIESLELLLKAAKGESIDDPDDLDKKLHLLQLEIDAEDEENEIKTKLSVQSFKDSFDTWGYQLLEKLAETTIKFNSFYSSTKHGIVVGLKMDFPFGFKSPEIHFSDKLDLNNLKEFWNVIKDDSDLPYANIRFDSHFEGFKKGGVNTFGSSNSIEIKFEAYKYEIFVWHNVPESKNQIQKSFGQRLLHVPLSAHEINEICAFLGDELYNHILRNKK